MLIKQWKSLISYFFLQITYIFLTLTSDSLNLQIKQIDELNTIPEDLCLGILISCKTKDTLLSQIPF